MTKSNKQASRKPHPIDVYAGDVLQRTRSSKKISQSQLANHLKITFQQIQKYEKGTNRISLSKFWMICEFLNVSPLIFFEGTAPAAALTESFKVIDTQNDGLQEIAGTLHRLGVKVKATNNDS